MQFEEPCRVEDSEVRTCGGVKNRVCSMKFVALHFVALCAQDGYQHARYCATLATRVRRINVKIESGLEPEFQRPT